MEIHDIKPNTPEWEAHRRLHLNASDAPVIMSVSPHKTRLQFIKEVATGVEPEVSEYVEENVYKPGHQLEALARPLAAAFLGENLFPVVGSSGKYGASFDGLIFSEEIHWEHKRLNKALREFFARIERGEPLTGNDLDPLYTVQMEHQCMVAGTERVLFSASEWNNEKQALDIFHCWYTPDPELRARLVAAWEQFEADVAAYVPTEPREKLVAEAVESLPSVFVQATGAITIAHNFPLFEAKLRDFLEHTLIREPKTDQDFVDLADQIKKMEAAEEALDSVEAQMLAQVKPVDDAKRTKDMLAKLLKDNRIMATKLLDTEKERRKAEIVTVGTKGLAAHVANLNERLGRPLMPKIAADFPGVIKGKRSLDSMEAAIDAELLKAKLAASETADRIEKNLKAIAAAKADELFAADPALASLLFTDEAALVLKAPEDCLAVIENRVSTEKQRREALAKQAREKAEKAAADASAKAAAAAAPAPQEASASNVVEPVEQQAQPLPFTAGPRGTLVPAPAVRTVAPSPAPAAANTEPVDDGRTITLGEVKNRLGFALTGEFVASLGITTAKGKGSAVTLRACDWPLLCRKLSAHVLAAADIREAA